MPTYTKYSLFFAIADPSRSIIVKHTGDGAKHCRCSGQVDPDHFFCYSLPRASLCVLRGLASDHFIGGSDVQNFIAFESFFLTIRAVCANKYRGIDRRPRSAADELPFLEKYAKLYCLRLWDIATDNNSYGDFPSWPTLLDEIIQELARLHLSRQDVSSLVAVSADVLKRNLATPDVEDRWSTYARLPRTYHNGSSSSCVGGRLVLASSAALEPLVQRNISAEMQKGIVDAMQRLTVADV